MNDFTRNNLARFKVLGGLRADWNIGQKID